MGELFSSIENDLIDIIRQDLSEKMKNIIIDNNLDNNTLLGPYKRPIIHFCSYYGSIKCLKELINMDFDINKIDKSSYNSPLFIACKFNFLEIIFILLNNDKQKCETLRKNLDGLNEFEVAFLRGNYEACFYLLHLYKNTKENISEILKINLNLKEQNKNEDNEYIHFFNNENFSIEKYLGIQEYLSYPVFNMPLFYDSLKQKINPGNCPSFAPDKKRTKELLTKLPDPNETWGNFIKRLVRLELYNPPMIDKNKVSKANSIYMKTQMKMISMEYGIPIDYCEQKDLKINNKNDNIDEEKKTLKKNYFYDDSNESDDDNEYDDKHNKNKNGNPKNSFKNKI